MWESLILTLITGCVKNPTTGKLQLDLMGEDNEIRYGNTADASLTKQIGLYPDEDLQAAVASLGAELAAVSERPSLPWTFRVLDDATVNAFAAPGGHVYITRGLAAQLTDRDELAVVLGHEVGHVAARHSVVQISKGVLFGVGLGAVSVLDPYQRHVGKLAAQGAESLFLSFSRNDELAADDLGVRYVTAIGRDPIAFLPVFDMLQRVEDQATGGERLPTRLRTHPQSSDRRARLQMLGDLGQRAPEAEWLSLIDDIIVGQNPREGFFVGSSYLHPEMAFRFTSPDGWTGTNSRDSVMVANPEQDAMVQISLSDAESAALGMRALCEAMQISEPSDPKDGVLFDASAETGLKGFAAYVDHRDAVFELVGLAPAAVWTEREAALRATIASFGPLTDAEVLGVQPMRLSMRTLEADTTLRALDATEPSALPLEALAILNRVEPDQTLPQGQIVKWVTGFNPETASSTWASKR